MAGQRLLRIKRVVPSRNATYRSKGGVAAIAARRRGFSLLEVVIVLVVLGTLAAVFVPRLGAVTDRGRQGELRDALRLLRTQIQIYKAQHEGVAPGYPDGNLRAEPTAETFVAQLTACTTPGGRLANRPTATAFLGPYLPRMLANPIKGNGMLRILGPHEFPGAAPGGPEGWVYQPATGMIAANVAGSDADGVAFFDY